MKQNKRMRMLEVPHFNTFRPAHLAAFQCLSPNHGVLQVCELLAQGAQLQNMHAIIDATAKESPLVTTTNTPVLRLE
jgi:hypothetical protein